ALFIYSLSRSFVHLFKGGGVEGQSPRRRVHAAEHLSYEALFSGELPRCGKRGLFAREKAPLHK
ncbi:hypothetical protein D7Y41_31545, partial [Anaerotruncus sp. 1XD22-93]